ncbi:neurotrypsin-like [Lytechinus pictus]|uniref:neurotrypsin-like n=1 Tax=Lytechinus pictus TaxID=7653 RepID=UPI0030BA0928
MNWHRIILVFLMTLLMQYNNHMVSCVITDVQLVGGPVSNKGTVEIWQDGGDWETTCGINLGFIDVIVICRQLGLAGASLAMTNTTFGQNSPPGIGSNCNGSEGSLSACLTILAPPGCSSAGSASCHGDGYLGCFVDVVGNRVLSGSMNMSQSMSISYCIQFCQDSTTSNYTYAGVESGNECYCGKASDNYTRHGVGVDSDCSVPCHGDPTESCGGGSGYIAVFTTAMTTTVNTPTMPTTVFAPLSTTSIVTSTNQVPTTDNGDRISSSSPPPQPPSSSSSPSSSPSSSSSSSSPPPPSTSPILSSSLKPQGTSNL